ncbi:hypothetical protein MTO96_023207 [Rhipicephalus appendiculatus]
MPEPANLPPHNFPACTKLPSATDLLASDKIPASMNTPVLSIPEPRNVSVLANLPVHEKFTAPAKLQAQVNLVAPFTDMPSLSSAAPR